MSIQSQQIIPAVSNFKALKAFFVSSHEYCVLMDFQLAELHHLIEEIKSHNKKVIIHIDLIKGLSSNEYGAIHAIQNLHVDGIISIKSAVIQIAKKRNVIGIFRIFLKDTLSLRQSTRIIESIKPDYVEVLPAVGSIILKNIKDNINAPIICGGLIQSKQQIQDCLDSGAIAVTTSNTTFWT